MRSIATGSTFISLPPGRPLLFEQWLVLFESPYLWLGHADGQAVEVNSFSAGTFVLWLLGQHYIVWSGSSVARGGRCALDGWARAQKANPEPLPEGTSTLNRLKITVAGDTLTVEFLGGKRLVFSRRSAEFQLRGGQSGDHLLEALRPSLAQAAPEESAVPATPDVESCPLPEPDIPTEGEDVPASASVPEASAVEPFSEAEIAVLRLFAKNKVLTEKSLKNQLGRRGRGIVEELIDKLHRMGQPLIGCTGTGDEGAVYERLRDPIPDSWL